VNENEGRIVGSVFEKYKQILITCSFYIHLMKGKVLAIGLFVFVISLIGYMAGPAAISQMMDSFTGGVVAHNTGPSIDPYRMMGIPTPEEMGKMTQYSSLALMLGGLGAIVFGILGKKGKPKAKQVATIQQENNTTFESSMEIKGQEVIVDEETQTNNRSIEILQERLAKGEITSNEYLNLKRLLDK